MEKEPEKGQKSQEILKKARLAEKSQKKAKSRLGGSFKFFPPRGVQKKPDLANLGGKKPNWQPCSKAWLGVRLLRSGLPDFRESIMPNEISNYADYAISNS